MATSATTQTFSTDWLNIVNFSNIGTLTNNATIFDGFPNNPSPGALSLYVDPTSYVGEFVNDRRIYATESATPFIGNNVSTAYATATAVRFDGVVPLATNNGLISAIAYAHDFASDGYASADRVRGRGAVDVRKRQRQPVRQVRQQRDGEGGRQRLCPATLLRRLLGGGACDRLWGTPVADRRRRRGGRQRPRTGREQRHHQRQVEGGCRRRRRGLGHVEAIGIRQFLDKAETVRARAVNNNKIVAHAVGLASATVGSANATYVRAVGISQSLDADLYDGSWQDGLLAKAFARNNGTITAFSKASAHATYGTAAANASAAGISQYVHGGSRLSSAFARNTGDILVTAKADAGVYVGTYAGAHASAAGIYQQVDGASDYPLPGSVASATAKNSGNITVAAIATAGGTYVGNTAACLQLIGGCNYGAVARATAAGISQGVYDAQTARALATNSGNINVLAEQPPRCMAAPMRRPLPSGPGCTNTRPRAQRWRTRCRG